MKILKYILGLTCIMILGTSCDLDVKMYDKIIAEDFDPRNLDKAHLGSYRLLKNDNGLIDGGIYFWNYGADDLTWNGTSTGTSFKLYDYSRNVNNTLTEYAWELGYRIIGNCNDVLFKVEDFFGSDLDTEKRLIKGESHYLRALSYFYLVNEFAQPYSNNPTQNPGLPLKLDNNPDRMAVPQERSTVAEVYDQIVLDLKDAIEYMTLPAGTESKTNVYATKEAAEALLARVYLYMENWDEAFKMADSVIKSGRFELEKGERYATYPQHVPEDNKETIFAVRRTALQDDEGAGRYGGLFIRIDNNGWEEISASSPYLELIELHHNANSMPQDLRSRYIVKRYVEDGVNDYSVTGYPNRTYNNWCFAYARKQAGNNANYEYKKIPVTKEADGTFTIKNDADKALFKNAKIQVEDYNLGKRYYVRTADNVKHIGRVEPEVFDAATKRGKANHLLVYSINKASYQEQRKHLYSVVISRLSEMYLIRAEVSARKGQTQSALDDVNVIRQRANIPLWTTANMATANLGKPKDILDIVEEERMLELAWEGHRRFDVFRQRKTLNRKYPGGHTMSYGDKYIEIPYNSPSVCEFIPQKQFDIYPYPLVQNP